VIDSIKEAPVDRLRRELAITARLARAVGTM
jgi:hypothetical protein